MGSHYLSAPFSSCTDSVRPLKRAMSGHQMTSNQLGIAHLHHLVGRRRSFGSTWKGRWKLVATAVFPVTWACLVDCLLATLLTSFALLVLRNCYSHSRTRAKWSTRGTTTRSTTPINPSTKPGGRTKCWVVRELPCPKCLSEDESCRSSG